MTDLEFDGSEGCFVCYGRNSKEHGKVTRLVILARLGWGLEGRMVRSAHRCVNGGLHACKDIIDIA